MEKSRQELPPHTSSCHYCQQCLLSFYFNEPLTDACEAIYKSSHLWHNYVDWTLAPNKFTSCSISCYLNHFELSIARLGSQRQCVKHWGQWQLQSVFSSWRPLFRMIHPCSAIALPLTQSEKLHTNVGRAAQIHQCKLLRHQPKNGNRSPVWISILSPQSPACTT